MTAITTVEGIGPAYAEKLKNAGIESTEALLEACATPKGRQALAQRSGIEKARLLRWANYIDLFRIKGVARQYAELLEAAGVDTVPELAQRNPTNLARKLKELNDVKRLAGNTPNEAQVSSWIAQANELPRLLHY